MAHIIEEKGRAYLIQNNRVMAVAQNKEDLLPKEEGPIQIDDRVEAAGKLGYVTLLWDTMYGKAASVRLDSGEYESVYVDELKHSAAPPIVQYASAVANLVAEFEEYKQMGVDTVEEIDRKEVRARQIATKAKALASDSKLPFSDRVKVGSISTVTSTDPVFLAEERVRLLQRDEESPLPRYQSQVAEGSSRFSREDISWIEEEAEVADLPDEWRDKLVRRATRLVERLSVRALDDGEFMQEVTTNSLAEIASGLPDFDTHLGVFRSLVSDAARLKRLGAEFEEEFEEPIDLGPGPISDPERPLEPEFESEEGESDEEEENVQRMIFDALYDFFDDSTLHGNGKITGVMPDGNEFEISVKHLGLTDKEDELEELDEPVEEEEYWDREPSSRV